MYLHTITKLLKGKTVGKDVELPVPVRIVLTDAEVREITGTNSLDKRLLVIRDEVPATVFDAIKTISERVGGNLAGVPIEIDIRKSNRVGREMRLPFTCLSDPFIIRKLPSCLLVVEIV